MQAHPPGEICRSMMATEMTIGLPWQIVVLHSLSTVSCMDCCLHHHTADLCFSYTCSSEFKTSKQMTHLLHLMDNNPFIIFSFVCHNRYDALASLERLTLSWTHSPRFSAAIVTFKFPRFFLLLHV
jgi:hypothetical protein